MSSFEERMNAADPAADLVPTSADIQAERARAITGDAPPPRRWGWVVLLIALLVVAALVVVNVVGRDPGVPGLASPSASPSGSESTPSPTSESPATSQAPSPTPEPSPSVSVDAHEAAVALLELALANPPQTELVAGQYLVVREWGTMAGPAVGKGDPLWDGWILGVDETHYLPAAGSRFDCTANGLNMIIVGTYGSINTDGLPPTPSPPGAGCTEAQPGGWRESRPEVELPVGTEELRAAVERGVGVRKHLDPRATSGEWEAMIGFLANTAAVEVVATEVDVRGRPGTAITVPGQVGAVQHTWFFDPLTGGFLGTQYVVDGVSYISAIEYSISDSLPEQVVVDACRSADEQADDSYTNLVCPR